MKGIFATDHVVGTREWGLDVGRFISDRAKSMSELVPHSQHINLQARRVKFVMFGYWAKSHEVNLSADVMGGAMSKTVSPKQGMSFSGDKMISNSFARK